MSVEDSIYQKKLQEQYPIPDDIQSLFAEIKDDLQRIEKDLEYIVRRDDRDKDEYIEAINDAINGIDSILRFDIDDLGNGIDKLEDVALELRENI